MTQRTVIYIPGIGDRRRGLNRLQAAFLATWQLYGFSARLFVMDWKSADSFDERFGELLKLIDQLHSQGRVVSLVGASAAAPVVLLGLMERPGSVAGIATICGQIDTKEALAGQVAASHPRFKTALARWDAKQMGLTPAQRHRVLTLRPIRDAMVPRTQQLLSGATKYDMPIAGHMLGIGFGLLFEGRRMAKFFASHQLLAANR